MINQSTAIGMGTSHIWGQDIEAAVPPGRALILLESGDTDGLLLESGDYYLQEV